MKRLLKFILVVLLVIIGAIAAVPLIVPVEAYKEEVASRVKQMTGRDLKVEGEISATIFPRIGLHVEKVSFSNPPGYSTKDMMRIRSATAEVDPFSIISGQIKVTRFVLENPVFNLEVNKQGKPNWEFEKPKQADVVPEPQDDGFSIVSNAYAQPLEPIATDSNASRAHLLDMLNMDTLLLSRGTLIYADQRSGQRIELSSINMEVNMPRFDALTQISGNAIWNGETLAFNHTIDSPQSFFAGKETRVKKQVRSEAFTLDFDGKSIGMNFSGKIEFATPSLVRVGQLVGHPFAWNAPAPLALSGNGNISCDSLRCDLKDALLTLDENVMAMNAAIIHGAGIPKVALAVRSEKMDFTGYVPAGAQADASPLFGLISSAYAEPITATPTAPTAEPEPVAAPAAPVEAAPEAAPAAPEPAPTPAAPAEAAPAAPEPAPTPAAPAAEAAPVTPQPAPAKTAAPALVKAATAAPEPAPTPAAPVEEKSKFSSPYAALNLFEARVVLEADELVFKKLVASNVRLNTEVIKGALHAELQQAALYEGKWFGKLNVDPKRPSGNIYGEMTLQRVQVEPLYQALFGRNDITGVLLLRYFGDTEGATADEMLANISGRGRVAIANGAIKGVNLAQMFRNVKATLADPAAAKSAEVQQTDFSALNISYLIRKGVMTNAALTLAAPLLKASGDGTLNFVTKQLDYRLIPEVVPSLEGQGGKQVAGIKVPLLITGVLPDLKVTPDVQSAITEAVKDPEKMKEAVKNIKEVVKENKPLVKDLKKKLKEDPKAIQNLLKNMTGQ